MTYRDLYRYFHTVVAFASHAGLPLKLSVPLAVRVKKLRSLMEVVEEKRLELAREHARKDEHGKPISKNGQYVQEDQAAFDAAFKGLLHGVIGEELLWRKPLLHASDLPEKMAEQVPATEIEALICLGILDGSGDEG